MPRTKLKYESERNKSLKKDGETIFIDSDWGVNQTPVSWNFVSMVHSNNVFCPRECLKSAQTILRSSNQQSFPTPSKEFIYLEAPLTKAHQMNCILNFEGQRTTLCNFSWRHIQHRSSRFLAKTLPIFRSESTLNYRTRHSCIKFNARNMSGVRSQVNNPD